MILVKPKVLQDYGIDLDSNSLQLDPNAMQLQLVYVDLKPIEVAGFRVHAVDMFHMNLTNCTIFLTALFETQSILRDYSKPVQSAFRNSIIEIFKTKSGFSLDQAF